MIERLSWQVSTDTDGAAAAYAPRRSLGGLGLVVLLHVLLAWALVSGLAQRMVEVVRSPIETRLIEEAKTEPPPPPPVLPPPTTPLPRAAEMPVPEVVATAPPPPAPVPAPAPSPLPPPPSPAPVPAPAPAIRAAPPPAPAVAARSPEQIYAGRLLAYVDSIKHYPTSREARQLRPEGTVRLWLLLDRQGGLLDSGVEESSGVLLLDHEALRTVRNGRFPRFPEEAFAGQPSHRFVVAMAYQRPGG